MSSKQFTSWRSMTSTHYDSHRLLANLSWYIHINSEWKFSALFNNSVRKCCLHSFYYIFFRFTFIAAPVSLTMVRKRTDYTRNESCREHSLPGTKVPGSESSRELSFLGEKVPTRSVETTQRRTTAPLCAVVPLCALSAVAWFRLQTAVYRSS